jgi:uncharacterized Rmd1/YagE family protein
MSLFQGATSVRCRALYLGERLDVRALEQTQRLAAAPLCIPVGERGLAVLFRYGAVVLFHVAPLEEVGFLDQLKRFVGEPFLKPESEEVEIRFAADKPEGLESSIIYVTDLAIERLQIIAEILARSVALAYSEAVVRDSVGAIESWAEGLQATGASGGLEKQLRKHLGATLLMQHKVASRIEMGDKPDLLWDRPDLERIFLRLEDEYELKERDKTLERKLALITSTAEMMLTLVNNKHSNRLEWYIIILILVEIALTLFTMVTDSGIHHV